MPVTVTVPYYSFTSPFPSSSSSHLNHPILNSPIQSNYLMIRSKSVLSPSSPPPPNLNPQPLDPNLPELSLPVCLFVFALAPIPSHPIPSCSPSPVPVQACVYPYIPPYMYKYNRSPLWGGIKLVKLILTTVPACRSQLSAPIQLPAPIQLAPIQPSQANWTQESDQAAFRCR